MSEETYRSTQDHSYLNATIIPVLLDDAGLTANEFRVYCHICRRAGKKKTAFPGVRGIAEKCLLSKPTVINALIELEKKGMLVIEKTPGQVSFYHVTDTSEWFRGGQNEDPPQNGGVQTSLPPSGQSALPGWSNPLTTVVNLVDRGGQNEVTKGCTIKGTNEGYPPKEEGWERIELLRMRINTLFSRAFEEVWPNDDEHYLVDISKRPNCLQEMEVIADVFEKEGNGKYARSPRLLLLKWLEVYERCRNPVKESSRPPTISEMKTVIETLKREATDLAEEFTMEDSFGPKWNDPKAKARWKEIQAKIKELEGKMAKAL